MKNLTDKIGDIMFGKTSDKITKVLLVCCAIYIAVMIVMGIAS